MKYEKAEGVVITFDNEDIVTSSQDCGQTQWDAEYCDGVNQTQTKPFG